MEFIDNTGHIFSLPSYNDDPINLEYSENDYVFWLADSSVSINNYYIKPIRFIVSYDLIQNNKDVFDLEIYNSSNFYKLIGTKYLQQQLENQDNILKSVNLDKSQFKNKLTLSNDFYFDKDNKNENLIVTSENVNHKFYMFPFYVIGTSEIEGTFLNNIMIKLTHNEESNSVTYTYTPITVGCSFIDECEELIINGRNMGIRLPKEILKAVYSSSFYTKYADEKLLKNKLKELLLNYMNIKGETGNIKSMINSLKWFGWNNYVDISKLMKTDNHFQTQFILDHFSIDNDVKDTFKYFNNTNNISLSVLYNKETGESHSQDYNSTFIGEGKPVLEDLFDKTIEVVKHDITFYKPYYNFMFNELALKLDCLKYYYQQYFLPVHTNINRASIDYKVYANTTKLSTIGFSTMTDKVVYLPEYSKDINIVFPETNKLVFMQSEHLIDSKYNEFSNYNESYENEDLYYVNENCIVLPIKIVNKSNINTIYENYLNCKIILTATSFKQNDYGHYVYIDGKYIYKENFYSKNKLTNQITENDVNEYGEYIKYYDTYIKVNSKDRYDVTTTCLVNNNNFSFYQSENQYYKNFIIIPRLLNNVIDWRNSTYRLSLLINDKWFNYDFDIVVPNVYLDMGKLEYKYSIVYNKTEEYYPFRQLQSLSPLKFNSFMYEPDLITINTLFKGVDENNNEKVLTFLDKLLETDNSEHNIDESKMYDFYKKYYSNALQIPYNKKYYNRIHLFDIYDKNGNKLKYTGNEISIIDNKYKYYCIGSTFGTNIINKNAEQLYNYIKYIIEHNEIYEKYIKKYVIIKTADRFIIEDDKNIEYYPTKEETNYICIPLSDDPIDYSIFKSIINYDYSHIDMTLNLQNKTFVICNKFTNIIEHYNEEEYKNNFIEYFNNIDNGNVLYESADLIFYKIEEVINDNINIEQFYSIFFNEDCTSKLSLNEQINYDTYLMHNEKEWYIVLISQYPIASYPAESVLDIKTKTYQLDNYKIVYADYSIDKFLVNRMNIVKSNGYNHFDKRDLIITTVNNNDYQFNIDLKNKWEITKIYDINNVYTETSNTNIMIIPNNNSDNMYTEGYYNVKLNYTIAGLDNQVYRIIAEYKVEDNEKIIYPK